VRSFVYLAWPERSGTNACAHARPFSWRMRQAGSAPALDARACRPVTNERARGSYHPGDRHLAALAKALKVRTLSRRSASACECQRSTHHEAPGTDRRLPADTTRQLGAGTARSASGTKHEDVSHGPAHRAWAPDPPVADCLRAEVVSQVGIDLTTLCRGTDQRASKARASGTLPGFCLGCSRLAWLAPRREISLPIVLIRRAITERPWYELATRKVIHG
jgi:hypothetical protein